MQRNLGKCLLLLACHSVMVSGATVQDESGQLAGRILADSGVRGGLVVHLGSGDGKLTAAFGASDGYLVHGLDADAANVEKARRHVRSLGLYGPVSIDRLDGDRLPYVDSLVSLLVVQKPGPIDMDEILRVLCPGGVACIEQGDRWTTKTKPWPAEIDEWTHYLHDPSNNAVSNDTVVAPPRQLQWVGAPKWARSHDHLAGVSAAVSSGGRLFYIVDEGPTAVVVLDPIWSLVARNAFSGVVLWKRPIPSWQWHLRGFRNGPSDLARRLVAVGDRVYVTLGIDARLTALDAASGETVATFDGTENTREIIFHEGTLYIVAGQEVGREAAAQAQRRGERSGFTEVRSQRPDYLEEPPAKRLMAIDAESGRSIWTKSDADTAELMPCNLALGGDRLFFQNADYLLCLEAQSGREIWRTERPSSRSRPTWSAPTLVVSGDVVLSGDRAVAQEKTLDEKGKREVEWVVTSRGGQSPVGELIAFSADDGRRLWSSSARECYNSPVDVLVADGLVWTGSLVRASDPGIIEGLDLKTGEVKRTRPADKEFFSPGMNHHRCYRNKATNRYLLVGRSGVEFVDVKTGKPVPNHWTRGTCQYGIMPANGLLYAPPDSCACFIDSKLSGFCALAPDRGEGRETRGEGQEVDRLKRGPAYGSVSTPPSTPNSPLSDDWPTYRHDSARSGRANFAVDAKLQKAWNVRLGGRLSSVVVAGGQLLVAQIDAHTVHALDARDGRSLWSFTAGGRVDSPPTVWEGRVLFGSADGSIYCLRASDGQLAWRYRAAPSDQRIVAYGQVESAWPVPGSVLVEDGVVACAAGRSSYLDGGIRLVRLDAKTGRKLSETVVDDRDPATGFQRKETVRGTDMPGALPDVLSCDGESIYLRHRRFDLAGQPQEANVPHLFSSAGFLDDTWWHRAYWMLGTEMGNNYGGWPRTGNRVPAGRLLALDESTVYGFGRNQYIHHGAHIGLDGATVYHFRPPNDAEKRFTHYRAFAIGRTAGQTPAPVARGKRPAARPKQYRWTQELPLLARGIVLSEKHLFLAGPPDVLRADDPHATLAGSRGGLLVVVSTDDGAELSQYELEAPPVFDGLAAAGGRLYMATTDGSVVCFRGKR